ncbi:MAG: DUF4321 domain-containing protein [Candidatus Latescibacteria bacterium]|nr:DUF4321 domain-containing protein [Candidatus Latescibacterota bacterium]
MKNKSVGHLIVAIFVSILASQVFGEVLNVVFGSLGLEDNMVSKVLVAPLVDYEFYPMRLNLLVMTFTLGFSLNFNVLSLIGIGTAYYYVKYSY